MASASKHDIYLTPDGGKKMRFPALPESIERSADGRFMSFSTLSLGDVQIPRGRQCETIKWKGFFPGKARKARKEYLRSWCSPAEMDEVLRTARDRKRKCHLVITNTSINIDVYVKSYEGEYRYGAGDIWYTVEFVEARDISVYTVGSTPKKKEARQPAKKRKDAGYTEQKAYKMDVPMAENPWEAAQICMGDGSRWQELLSLNPDLYNDFNRPDSIVFPGD